MKKQIITLLALAIAPFGFAQEETVVKIAQSVTAVSPPTPSATIYGYVRGEFAFDSRQVIAARDANFITVPAGINRNANNQDINANPNFNGWGLESRLGVKAVGPEFFGMQSTAVLEGHFFGSTEASINGFGLRHAYVQLSNDNVEWIVGQYWHPMFVTNVSPMTYNFNAGHPFQPFNRSPQVRFSTKGNLRFTGALLTELDFKSIGGSAAQSAVPAVHAQLQFGDDSKFVGGLGVNYKTIRPALREDNVGAFGLLAYAKAKLGENLTWQVYGNYGQNPSELIQLGGVGTIDGKVKSNSTFSAWTEFYGDVSPSFEWGLFGGYTKDLGFSKQPTNYTTSTGDVISAWRVSPRFGWKSGNTKFTTEFDYTSATRGYYDANGKTKANAKDATVGNFRVSLSLIQSF